MDIVKKRVLFGIVLRAFGRGVFVGCCLVGLQALADKPSEKHKTLTKPVKVFRSPMIGVSADSFSVCVQSDTGDLLILRQEKGLHLLVIKPNGRFFRRNLPKHLTQVTAMVPIGKGKCLLSCMNRKKERWEVVQLSIADGAISDLFDTEKQQIHGLDHANGRLFVLLADRQGRVIDLKNDEPLCAFIQDDLPKVEEKKDPVQDEKKQVVKQKGHVEVDVWDDDQWVDAFEERPLPIPLICAVADGSACVTSSEDGRLEGWDATTGRHLWTMDGKEGGLVVLNRHPTEPTVLAARTDGCLLCLNAKTGNIVWKRVCDTDVRAASWSPDGTTVFALADGGVMRMISADGTVKKHRIFREVLSALATVSESNVVAAWSGSGNAVYAGYDGLVFSLDQNLGDLPPPAGLDPRLSQIVALRYDGGGSVVLGSPQLVAAAELDGEKVRTRWTHPTRQLLNVVISPNGRHVVVQDLVDEEGGHVKLTLLDRRTGRTIWSQFFKGVTFGLLDFCSNGEQLVIGVRDALPSGELNSTVVIVGLEVKTGKRVCNYLPPGDMEPEEEEEDVWVEEEAEFSPSYLAASPIGDLILGVAFNDQPVLWNTSDRQISKRLSVIPPGTEDLYFLSDGKRLKFATYASNEQDTYSLNLYDIDLLRGKPLTQDDVESAIKSLGADGFKARRKATKQLMDGGMSTLSRLSKTKADTSDPEIRARLKEVRQKLMDRIQLSNRVQYPLPSETEWLLPVPGTLDHWLAWEHDKDFNQYVLNLIRLDAGKRTGIRTFAAASDDSRYTTVSVSIGANGKACAIQPPGVIAVYDLNPYLPTKAATLRPKDAAKESDEHSRTDAADSKRRPIVAP